MMQIIYTTCLDSQQIYTWKLHSKSDQLELMQITHVTNKPQPILVHPNKKFLYVGTKDNYSITIYKIDQEGLLQEYAITQISDSPTYLACNVIGTFLYCVSYKQNTINVFHINQSGILSTPIQTIKNLLGCHAAKIDQNGTLLWVPCLQENLVRFFTIGIFGELTPWNPNFITLGIHSSPRHIIFHNIDNYVYLINEIQGSIYVIYYNFNENKINIIQTIDIIPHDKISNKPFWAADIHITPNGNWLYCSDRKTNTISCFKLSKKTKKLKFVDYIFTEVQPRSFAIDCEGNFLITSGQKSNHISLYRIHQTTGKLTMISRYQVGLNPIWIEVVSIN